MSNIQAPMFPESIAEGEVASWHVKEGQSVGAGDLLVEIETDKVVLEVQAPDAGVITKILKKSGETVLSQEVIGILEVGAVVNNVVPHSESSKTAEKSLGQPVVSNPSNLSSLSSLSSLSNSVASPSVRRLASSNEVDLSQVQGSGKKGRVTSGDVKSFMSMGGRDGQDISARLEERVPMTRLRKTVAKRLKDVQNTAAMLTTFNEVDMKAVMDLRGKYKDEFEKAHQVRLGFMSFFVKAVVEALKKFPMINASIDGEDVVYHGYFDIGVAVSSPRGLVVPVLRSADKLSMAGIEQEIKNYAVKAKEGSLSIEEMQGGTFTITNGGVFGSMLSTPIINAPQSAILGMHNIIDRPVVVEGQIVIRPIMYLALSYDHRLIDGRESVSFLKLIKDLLEDPARLLLGL